MQNVQKIFCRILVLLILLLGAGAVVLRPACLVQSVLHLPCPTCGMTSAWRAALGLDLRAAFALHPMFWSIPVLLAYLWQGGRLLRCTVWNRWMLGLILAGFAAHYAVVLAGLTR